ncbi:MAG TPA: 6-pyruvoyl-tetrahydropterin synthase-related protein, partial [Candidatus Ozemobacteraceae bacterium]|nr:6-pyruvoyl-tetrahydropterin synthase-related protein [Candidatus Ozemobacteraceae bacterium]
MNRFGNDGESWCGNQGKTVMTRALLGGAILLAYGWFFFGVEIYAAFDTVFHLYFAREFYEALLESLTWPDWDAFPYDGRGTPAFRFYAPVGYLISAALQLLGAPVQVALKGTILLFAVVGAIGVYYWFRRLGLRRERPLGAALFLSSPFLAVHLTRVFFFQNLLAILLFPWVCYGLAHRGRGRKRGGIIAGVTLGVMALTHLPATLMAGYLSVVILTLTRHGRETWSQVLRELLLIVALAAGIAAPYLLPAMAERTTVNFHSHMAIQEIGKPGDFLDDRRIDDLASATASFSGASEFFAPQLHARFRLLLLCVLIGSIPLWTVPATKLSRRFWFCGLIPLPLLVRASLPI